MGKMPSNQSVLIVAGAVATIATVSCLLLLSFYKVRTPKRPKMAILERWYASSPKRRRVVAAIPQWKKSAKDTQILLSKLQAKHLLLRCHFDGNTWIETSNRIVVENLNEKGWQDAAEHLLTQHPKSAEKLWRVALADGGDTLIVMVDHVLSDGLGLAGLVDDLLSNVRSNEQVLFPVPLEAEVDVSISARSLYYELAKSKPSKDAFIGPLILGDNLPSIDKTNLQSTQMDAQLMSKIKARCKQQSTSVHAFICAASSLALFETVAHELHVKLLTPASLRHRASSFATVLGNYVAPLETNYHMDGTIALWDLAREIKASLKTNGCEREIGLINLLSNVKEFLEVREQQHPMGRSATLEVSNLGVCATAADWYFAQGNHYIGPLLAVNVATSAAGKMFITVTTRSLCVDTEALRSFIKRLIHIFEDV